MPPKPSRDASSEPGDEQSLRRCLGRCLGWGTLISMLFVGIYLIWWRDLLGIFIKAGTPDAAQVVSTAGNYIVWIILIPLASAMPFIMDGIMVGATETKVMRNSMLLSTVAYFGIFYSLYPVIGNNALWLAFTLYMFLRRHAATPDDPAPAAHLSKSCGINFPTYLRPAKDGPSSSADPNNRGSLSGRSLPLQLLHTPYCNIFFTVTKRLYGSFLFCTAAAISAQGTNVSVNKVIS